MKNNKVVIIAAAIVAFIIAAVIFVAFGIPVINANAQMREISNGFSELGSEDIIVLSDPMQSGSVVDPDTTQAFEGDIAKNIAQRVFELTDGAKYKKTRKAAAGSWDINISLRSADATYVIYFEEGGFYVTESVREYFFEPSRDMMAEYESFYEEINNILYPKRT